LSKTPTNPLNISGSEIVEDSEKRQYHIALAPSEVANTVLLVGDPKRAEKISMLFDSVRIKKSNREFLTFTGTYKNTPLTVISTGIGTSNVEIVIIELSRIFSKSDEIPTLIRVGSCGSLQESVEIGDLVISTGAVRLEDTSKFFVDEGYPALADFEVVNSLITSAERNNFPYHVGITATASGFYGAQGREIPNFPIKDADLPEKLARWNVINFEMESSTLFTLASLAKYRTGTICVVYANRPKNTFIEADQKDEFEHRAMKCGLDAVLIIRSMDKIKMSKKAKYWHSDLNIHKEK
jgi:uridine phosphorylase